MKAIAEAPAKVIITGEHFVVHGAWALAAAVNRRVRVEVSDSDDFSVYSDQFRERDTRVVGPVKSVVSKLALEYSFKPAVHVSIRSGIPHGAGLGSSASTMVALVSALSKLRSLKLTTDLIIALSMVGENQIHGRPSGIDSTICATGGVILFKPGNRPRHLRFKGKRSLIVAYSGKSRSTKRQIARVSGVKETFPSLFEGLTEAASELSLMAADRLSKGDMRGVGRLLSFNHAVLSTLGVSNRPLDRLVDLFLSLGSYGAKLTGAGGGGSVIAVAPEGKEKSIISEVEARGFVTFKAKIPVEGVKSWLGR